MKDESVNPYEPPPSIHQLFWWNRPRSNVEPQRLLDDVAHAFHRARKWASQRTVDPRPSRFHWFWGKPRECRSPRRIYRTLWIDELLECKFFDIAWKKLGEELDSKLPTLERGQDRFLYWHDQRASVQHLIGWLIASGKLGDRAAPAVPLLVGDWANAQVFAGVQEIVVEQLGVDKDKVTRSTHFVDDLGAD